MTDALTFTNDTNDNQLVITPTDITFVPFWTDINGEDAFTCDDDNLLSVLMSLSTVDGFYYNKERALRIEIDDPRVYIQRPADKDDYEDEDNAGRISDDGWIDCMDDVLDVVEDDKLRINELISQVWRYQKQAPVPREPEKARILLGNDYLIDLLDTLSREADEREWYELPEFEITIKRLPNEDGFVAVGLPSLLNMAD